MVDKSSKQSVYLLRAFDAEQNKFLNRVLIVAGVFTFVVLFLLMLWFIGGVVLLAFASILLAVFIHKLTDNLHYYLKLPYYLLFAGVVLTFLTLLWMVGWLLVPQLLEQVAYIQKEIPRLIEEFNRRFQHTQLGNLYAQLPQIKTDQIARELMGQVPTFLTTTVGGLGSAVAVIVIAFYLAANPAPYIAGVLYLIPRAGRERAEEVLDHIGNVLWRWMVGRLFGMVVVGALTTIGLLLLDIPLAVSLGVLAALLDFIPNVGPILAAVPALLVGVTVAPWAPIYIVALYIAIQVIEGYLLLPMIEKRAVFIPPAVTLFVQLLMYVLFGFLGLMLAIPVFAAILVLVKMLYVNDMLGDNVEVAPHAEGR